MNTVIKVEKLVKEYKGLTAVKGISFEVKKGEIFGLLGENGAGKTTTLEMIEGLRKPTSGEISVLGHNVRNEISEIKERIGVQLQSSAYYNYLTLKEILSLFGSFYTESLDPDDLLKMVDLEEKAGATVNNLSGGQKQRFSIVASLVNDPEIVFLDEPTTGLDPMARRNLWDIITKIKAKGKTIILTTHYLEEAEMLCDRIAIMEKGEILMMGKTHELIESTKNPFKTTFIATSLSKETLKELEGLGEVNELAGKSHHFEMMLKTQVNLNKAIKIVQKLEPESITVGRSTLEDLFIELTGKRIGGE
ncbi:TPA: ABC transporter [candidate division CPR2 bacterium]|uniref:ABC transporter related protein n=1 Tax=candidate division CPR2 bacterium GW2011_GWC1_41_48 TaxID=1618344 RepID=A0A0G0WA19_UNCC2|nr:MAG: ABC transporter related protein [candidate division CPR2 bacterium GW2011_GWC2_39_35]KKR28127.1 MAG: ABC transporter related protein [candidate division CPR2 bacterium GW2011_GWD2_39_7]KKR29548.1 MAG: ABC transporter related protein [candidate division CPR2 bacterium GW2011_GWD1_39_7]KKS09815.1 MAG: ABC transporter related protein [candidate division CPR2 bacterium GW2011_GWC1_41_48]HBG81610.1 ABC transporter [candidate division CPR2 bacterium]